VRPSCRRPGLATYALSSADLPAGTLTSDLPYAVCPTPIDCPCSCGLLPAGADKAIASAAFANQVAHPPADPSKAVTLCSASGIHVLSIPNYIIGTWLASFHRLPKQLHFAKVCCFQPRACCAAAACANTGCQLTSWSLLCTRMTAADRSSSAGRRAKRSRVDLLRATMPAALEA
jgi:hypothetical protein